jgi:hypothetical protein
LSHADGVVNVAPVKSRPPVTVMMRRFIGNRIAIMKLRRDCAIDCELACTACDRDRQKATQAI